MIKTQRINNESHTIRPKVKTPLYTSIFIESPTKKDESTN